MTKEQINQQIEDLFQKAFRALDEKLINPNSQDDPRIYFDRITELLIERENAE